MGDKTLLNIVSNKINFFWESFLKAESNTYEVISQTLIHYPKTKPKVKNI